MPKSKRSKVGECVNYEITHYDAHPMYPLSVALTKTKKKGKEWKEGLVQQVRDSVEK
jgi:hypothetical protein